MSGGGNDFAVFDDRERRIVDPVRLAVALTTRRLSVGADGIILIRDSHEASVKMEYYNADGSLADFCANGTRCAARFAYLYGMAEAQMTIETGYAIVNAAVERDRVILGVPSPTEYRERRPLRLADGSVVEGAYMMVGVPHYVLFVEDDLWARDIDPLGREIRRHRDLPHGANVNFVRVAGRNRIEVRTWERGVEGETMSCGSGVIASSSVAALMGKIEPPLEVLTRSGIVLTVRLRVEEEGVESINLMGDARVIYRGELTEESASGFDPTWVRNPTAGRRGT